MKVNIEQVKDEESATQEAVQTFQQTVQLLLKVGHSYYNAGFCLDGKIQKEGGQGGEEKKLILWDCWLLCICRQKRRTMHAVQRGIN